MQGQSQRSQPFSTHTLAVVRFAMLGMACGNAAKAQSEAWNEVQRLGTPSGPVSIDFDSGRLVVGVEASLAMQVGRVFALEKQGIAWNPNAKELIPPPRGVLDTGFGHDVAIDGTTAVASAIGESSSVGNASEGAVHVFELVAGSWVHVIRLTHPDPKNLDYLGYSVDIDGNRIVAGAPGVDHLGNGPGAAFVYERNALGLWNPTPTLLPLPQLGSDTNFGWSVSIAGDNILVSAPDNNSQNGLGAVHAYHWNGSTWDRTEILPQVGIPGSEFGAAVSIHEHYAVIGAPDAYGTAVPGTSKAYAVRKIGSAGTWTTPVELSRPDSLRLFGFDVHVSDHQMVVGRSRGNPTANPGQAYVYERVGQDWILSDTLTYGLASPNTNFATAVAASDNEVFVSDSVEWTTVVFRPLGMMTSVCSGDGSGTPCPCGNATESGTKQGCGHSGGFGAHIDAFGTNSVSADDMQPSVSLAPVNTPALLFAGDGLFGAGAGVVFGDGLMCAGGNIQRLEVKFTNSPGPIPVGWAAWGPGLIAQGGWSAGDTRYFQVWYRDNTSYCALETFNFSNALRVTFVP